MWQAKLQLTPSKRAKLDLEQCDDGLMLPQDGGVIAALAGIGGLVMAWCRKRVLGPDGEEHSRFTHYRSKSNLSSTKLSSVAPMTPAPVSRAEPDPEV